MTDKEERVLTAEEIDLVIEYGLRPVLAFVSGKVEDFKRAKEDIQKVIDPAELDKLEMQPSEYGGFWIRNDLVPANVKRLKFPIETVKFRYSMSPSGHLRRFEKKEASEDAD